MANYKINKYTFGPGSAEEVAALIETQLELLDSTNNPIYLLQVVEGARGKDEVEGILIVGVP